MHDDERRLAERLRRYESRIPVEHEAPVVVRPSRVPMWAMGTVAAALVGVAILGANLVVDDGQVANASPTATPSPSPSLTASESPSGSVHATPSPSLVASATATPQPPVATPTPAPLGVGWEGSVQGWGEVRIHRITSEGGRFWALGSIEQDPVIWSSTDGTSWEDVTLPFPNSWDRKPSVFVFVSQLASVGDRLVAVGTVGAIDNLNVVAWESTDRGESWTELATGSFMQDAFATTDITNGPAGLVVATHGNAPGTGSAWRSTNGGRTWTEHAPPGQDLGISAVVGTASRYLLAGMVGESCCGEPTSPRIWSSEDGATWTQASVEGSDRVGRVHALTVDGSGRWLAVGALDQRIVTWRSSDGTEWTLSADLRAARLFGVYDEPDTHLLRLIGHPDGYIVFDGGDPLTTWTSRDGFTWTSTPVASPGGLRAADSQIGFMNGIARVGDTVILAGEDYLPASPDAAFVWIGRVR